MCIIVIKPKMIKFPDKETLKNCFDYNSDGAGLMYREVDKSIHIVKGFMKFKGLWSYIDKNREKLEQTDTVIHFRMGTHGVISQGNTHPFPVTTKIKELRKTDIHCDRAIAHNGILYAHEKKGSDLSDTMIFVKYLSGLSDTLIASHILREKGKFCYMSMQDTIIVGDFIEENNGVLYSNETYLPLEDYGIAYFDKWSHPGIKESDYQCPEYIDELEYLRIIRETGDMPIECLECHLEKCCYDDLLSDHYKEVLLS